MEIDKPQAAMSRTEQSGCVWGVGLEVLFLLSALQILSHTRGQSQNGENSKFKSQSNTQVA